MQAQFFTDNINVDMPDTLQNFILDQTSFSLAKNKLGSTTIHLVQYDPNHYKDQHFTSLKIDQPQQSNSWLPKRKAQFLAGRLIANKALNSIDKHGTPINHSLPISKHREALWPEKFMGSISHSDDISIAVARRKSATSIGLGVDIQSIANDNDYNRNLATVLNRCEQSLIHNKKIELSDNQLFTLIFSAKESFFKAAFNSVRDYFNFDAVSVRAIDIDTQQLKLTCETTLSQDLIQYSEHTIVFEYIELEEPSIVTYCYLSNIS